MMHIELGPEANGHFQELLYEHLVELDKVGVRVFTNGCTTSDKTRFVFSTTNANLALSICNIDDHGRVCLAEVLQESFQRIPADRQRLVIIRFPNEHKPKFAMLVTVAKEEYETIFHCSPAR